MGDTVEDIVAEPEQIDSQAEDKDGDLDDDDGEKAQVLVAGHGAGRGREQVDMEEDGEKRTGVGGALERLYFVIFLGDVGTGEDRPGRI